jgi:hypothetical protein
VHGPANGKRVDDWIWRGAKVDHSVQRKQKRAEIKRQQYIIERMVPYVAAILFPGEPTKFRFEGFCRAALRCGLILQAHYSWHLADVLAEIIVRRALAHIGARRPNWAEGQPEFTAVPGFAPAERYYCERCGQPMPEGRRLYCSRICAQGATNDRRYRELREMSEAERGAMQMLRRQAKSDHFAARRTITCAWCNGLHEYKAGANARTYCSRSCAAKARHAALRCSPEPPLAERGARV